MLKSKDARDWHYSIRNHEPAIINAKCQTARERRERRFGVPSSAGVRTRNLLTDHFSLLVGETCLRGCGSVSGPLSGRSTSAAASSPALILPASAIKIGDSSSSKRSQLAQIF